MAEAIEVGPDSPKKSRKAKKIIIAMMLLLILGGGGVVAGYFASSAIHAVQGGQEDLDKPKLVSKIEPTIASKLADLKGDKRAPEFKESSFKATYYPIEAPFTSNLKNSNSFAQLSISIATYYDERVLENIQEHETAIRSTILLTVAEQDIITLSTPQGKQMLQELLTEAINQVLEEKAGFGGVNNVYFTSFVVQ